MRARSLAPSLLALACLAGPAPADIRVTQVATGILNPTDLDQPPGDDRLFVVSMRQGIWIIENGVVLPDRFLDMTPLNLASQGVMSMAFHPDYQNNGRFYVVYLDNALMNHLVEYQVSATDPNRADPSTARHILGPFQQPAITHNWNQVSFGVDGMLYLSTGDGLLSSDISVNNGQRLDTVLGKILRIDVDSGVPYAIPPDNPFVGVPGVQEEIWLFGLRQPWRYDWDPLTGDLYIADVGNGTREEISVLDGALPQAGANMGWRCLEGTVCQNMSGCLACGDTSYVAPIHEYPHDQGRCAIIGGVVYRGADAPSLFGKYIFADHCASRFWTLRYENGQAVDLEQISIPTYLDREISLPTAFARDDAGELYILDRGNGGNIWKVEEDPCQVLTICDAVPNSTGQAAELTTSGVPDVSTTDFSLVLEQGPVGQSCVFFYGASQGSVPFGNGTRCVVGEIFRFSPPAAIDAGGVASHTVDFTTPPALGGLIQAGSFWLFQGWYRDPAAGGANFNLSTAISISFCP